MAVCCWRQRDTNHAQGDGLACGELRRLQCRKITKKLGGCLLVDASALKTKTAVLRVAMSVLR
ncbi:hypothetical protein [Xylella fastidiosa]|uniref:Transposase n=1 Tax=Xylella fastidiosa subsp. multiplex TaxID=644357 RepID=A0AAW6HUH2_XYLFS|nr:hypothetical protein [Xylella fastidiosa]ACA11609.1 hypothetical protein Xfasm12_0605 [Xylella fastidiosa M12]MBS9446203.1 hypothetical protein [Xylella fastidiosa subsp. multiplex]MBS9448163.1 hypothetical protein [Xylella fastidiosa subsp. multiplex]MBS9450229.1 hypothetical protein [Xylella fastidiosa subsp. multiplex]MBS9452220.1 hypothetical protein [Xylella fastidiosa subsp. multiplex]